MLLAVAAHGWLLLGWSSAPGQAAAPPAMTVRWIAPGERPSAAAPEEQSQQLPKPGAAIAAAPAPAASAAVPAQSSAEAFQEDVYLPKNALSIAPHLQAPVMLIWPPDAPQSGEFTATMTLFIDELGVVRRVRIDDDGLPEIFQEQARKAFIGASYNPGQIDGHDVKSRIRIQVSFDGGPSAKAHGLHR